MSFEGYIEEKQTNLIYFYKGCKQFSFLLQYDLAFSFYYCYYYYYFPLLLLFGYVKQFTLHDQIHICLPKNCISC